MPGACAFGRLPDRIQASRSPPTVPTRSQPPAPRSARIADPHRAIDWLSTFPAVIELALGPAPTVTAPGAAGPDSGSAAGGS